MDVRALPLATFRDEATGEQETVQLTYHRRAEGKPDVCRPWPKRGGRKMTLIQLQYGRM